MNITATVLIHTDFTGRQDFDHFSGKNKEKKISGTISSKIISIISTLNAFHGILSFTQTGRGTSFDAFWLLSNINIRINEIASNKVCVKDFFRRIWRWYVRNQKSEIKPLDSLIGLTCRLRQHSWDFHIYNSRKRCNVLNCAGPHQPGGRYNVLCHCCRIFFSNEFLLTPHQKITSNFFSALRGTDTNKVRIQGVFFSPFLRYISHGGIWRSDNSQSVFLHILHHGSPFNRRVKYGLLLGDLTWHFQRLHLIDVMLDWVCYKQQQRVCEMQLASATNNIRLLLITALDRCFLE